MMAIVVGLLWAAALLMLFVGTVVLVQSARTQLSLRFFLFALACSGWVASNAAFVVVAPEFRLIIGLASYGAAGLLALYFFLFCRSLTSPHPSARIDGVAVIIGTANAFMSVIPGMVGVAVTDQLAMVTNLPLLIVYGVVLMVFFGGGLIVLVRAAKATRNRQERLRIRTLIGGLVLGIVIGVGCNLALPLLDNYELVQLGPIGSLALIAASSYAIVRHQLFDIKRAAIRSIVYILALLTLAGVYYVLAYILSQLFLQGTDAPSLSSTPITVALALVLAFLFQPVRRFFDRVTSHIFFQDSYNVEEFYGRLNQVLAAESELRPLLKSVAGEIAATFKAEQAVFVIKQADHRLMSAGTHHHTTMPRSDVEEFDAFVAKHDDTVIAAELLPERSHLRRVMVSHGLQLVMPLMQDDSVLGYLALGEHQSRGYTRRDIRIVGTIADELVVAIQHALSVQEIRDMNVHLEQRIDAATAELRTSNARLRRVDAAKDEFLSMASHQLRTPLTSIKGYLSMVLEGDVGRLTKAQRQVLEEAFTSSERMVHLIHDFLNVSRLQTGKFMLEKGRYDLAKVVQEEIDLLARVADSRQITIDYASNLPQVELEFDETKVRQVIINFIDNALYYSPPGSRIEIRIVKKTGRVEVTVKDTGIGVPLKEQAQLFEKFYRASNARKQRPDGTGVGLYLAKKIITAHGGDVLFSSRAQGGSTFGFWLPLLPLEDGAE